MEVVETGPPGQHVNTTAENIDLGAVSILPQVMEEEIVLDTAMRICHVMQENVQVHLFQINLFF